MLTPTEQMSNARRWDKCVDYASPRSAWTDEMLAIKREETRALQACLIGYKHNGLEGEGPTVSGEFEICMNMTLTPEDVKRLALGIFINWGLHHAA